MNRKNQKIETLRKLIKRVGSQEAFAEELTRNGLTIGQAGVSQWIIRENISLAGALLIEKVYNIPVDELR